jgi:two-component system, sporulation sensor kinase D
MYLYNKLIKLALKLTVNMFKLNINTLYIKWLILSLSVLLVTIIIWNTYSFFNYFKAEERLKMELWAQGQKSFASEDTTDFFDLINFINLNNKTIPIVLVDNQENIISSVNVDEKISKNEQKFKKYVENLKTQNNPIKLKLKNSNQYLYYGNSALITKLKYYPLALLLIIFLFILLIYNYYNSTKMAVENKLWAGMAKETAHQIGTPLSSLIGWIEILKINEVDNNIIDELNKDIIRLQTITDRFSKIGSTPILESHDLGQQILLAVDYLKTRFSSKVVFNINMPNTPILVMINPPLFGWTFENLIKNAIDAMKGQGKISIELINKEKEVEIYITDTGKGIEQSHFKKIFEPGFTTKKRGWGLGLSLTKRIIEEYHNGKIKVEKSEMNVGTTFKIVFKHIDILLDC